MAQKSKKGRKAYLNDFQPNLAGEYTYTGAHYRYAGKDKSYRRSSGESVLLFIACLLGLILPGCVSAGGMGNSFYVIIPYMAQAIAVFATLYAGFRMLRGGEKLREYIYTASVKRIPASALCCTVFAALGLICSVVYIIINGAGGPVYELCILFVGKIIGIAAPLALRRHILSQNWEKEQ